MNIAEVFIAAVINELYFSRLFKKATATPRPAFAAAMRRAVGAVAAAAV